MKQININIQKLHSKAACPFQATPASAGCDLFACLDNPVTIEPKTTVLIPLGFATEIPEGWFGAVYARSGLAVKQGLRPSNCVAVIDSDYRGEWRVPLYNDSNEPRVIEHGSRVAQVVFQEHPFASFSVVEKLNDTERGIGGFGSTGV